MVFVKVSVAEHTLYSKFSAIGESTKDTTTEESNIEFTARLRGTKHSGFIFTQTLSINKSAPSVVLKANLLPCIVYKLKSIS